MAQMAIFGPKRHAVRNMAFPSMSQWQAHKRKFFRTRVVAIFDTLDKVMALRRCLSSGDTEVVFASILKLYSPRG